MASWTEGYTQADRQRDWAKMSPERQAYTRAILEAAVEQLEDVHRHAPRGNTTAGKRAEEILRWLDFGDFDDIRACLQAIVGSGRDPDDQPSASSSARSWHARSRDTPSRSARTASVNPPS